MAGNGENKNMHERNRSNNVPKQPPERRFLWTWD